MSESINSIKSERLALERPSSSQKEQDTSSLKCAYIDHCLTQMLASSNKSSQPDVYYTVFKSMINNLKNHEDLFKTDAEVIRNYQKYQQVVMKQLRETHYLDMPDDVKDEAERKRIENENLKIDGERSVLQAQIDVTRQKSSVRMTEVRVDMQGDVRKGAEINNYIDKLNVATEDVLQLTKRN